VCNCVWSLIQIFKNKSVCVHMHACVLAHACTLKRGEETIIGFKAGPQNLHCSQNFFTLPFYTSIL
jgi:hypothetical protein